MSKTEEKPQIPNEQKSDRAFYLFALLAVVCIKLLIYIFYLKILTHKNHPQVLANVAIQWNIKEPSNSSKIVETKVEVIKSQKPKYFLYGKSVDSGYLKHVINVLERLGLERTFNGNDSWDLMWAHDYPFGQLKPLL